jgi:hypothetical protein
MSDLACKRQLWQSSGLLVIRPDPNTSASDPWEPLCYAFIPIPELCLERERSSLRDPSRAIPWKHVAVRSGRRGPWRSNRACRLNDRLLHARKKSACDMFGPYEKGLRIRFAPHMRFPALRAVTQRQCCREADRSLEIGFGGGHRCHYSLCLRSPYGPNHL